MANRGTPRNAPCPCGSGKKYRHCCYHKDCELITANKKKVTLSLDKGEKITRSVKSLDSIPTHNRGDLKLEITTEQVMDLCLEEIHKILETSNVGMLADHVDTVILKMDIVPTFTYRQIANRMGKDGRFAIYQKQICSLYGTDPLTLITKKLSSP